MRRRTKLHRQDVNLGEGLFSTFACVMQLCRFSSVVLLALLLGASPTAAQVADPLAELLGESGPASLLDDYQFEVQARRGLGFLYNMQFTEARNVFDGMAAAYPDHPAGAFLQGLVPWWRILSDLTNEEHDEPFYEAMDEVIRRSDRILESDRYDVDARFFKGAALAFRARLRANRRDYLRAAFDAKGATDYVLDVARLDRSNPDYGFAKGVYDYYAATLRKERPRFKPLLRFFARGDRERGLQLLKDTFEHGTYLQAEAAYQLALIHYLHERDYRGSLEYINWLRYYYPRNAFFHTLEGRVHAGFGRLTEADSVFTAVISRHDAGESSYNAAAAEQALYYLGRNALAQDRPDEALVLLYRLQQLSASRGYASAFGVLGRLRQGMAHDVRGERDDAIRRYREVLDLADRGDAHDRARQYLETPYRRG